MRISTVLPLAFLAMAPALSISAPKAKTGAFQGTHSPGSTWLAAWNSCESRTNSARSKVLAKLNAAINAARRAGDRETADGLEAERDAFDRDGTWPTSINADNLFAVVWKAREEFLDTFPDAARDRRRARRSDAAEELERFREAFESTNHLGRSRSLIGKDLDLPEGWRRDGTGLLSPEASDSQEPATAIVAFPDGADSFLMELEVERTQGVGPLRIELPDCGIGRVIVKIGTPTSRHAVDPMPGGRGRLLIQWSGRGLFVLGKEGPLLSEDGVEWMVVEGGRGHDPSTLLVAPGDAATRFAFKAVELRGLSPWPQDVLPDPERVDTELQEGSEWTGSMKLDGKETACTVRVESHEGETLEMKVTAGRLTMTFQGRIDGSSISITNVTVIRDREFTIPRIFEKPRIRGSIKEGKVALKGSWHQEHPRQGTGKRSVELDITRSR